MNAVVKCVEMNAYVIQRVSDGAYVAPAWDTLTKQPHKAYAFCSRKAAQQYIARNFPAGFTVAILPATRPLLSVPKDTHD